MLHGHYVLPSLREIEGDNLNTLVFHSKQPKSRFSLSRSLTASMIVYSRIFEGATNAKMGIRGLKRTPGTR